VVKGRTGIVLEPQLPKKFQTGTEAIQKLEESKYKREDLATEDETPKPPRFVTQIEVCISWFIL
jgi:hypothetical protein